uniref:HORMA domain-containing protein n=1 Tax=Pelagomonas calceolata TaxID=35677 RepID=A0A7S3ZV24_9STRA|mmetsp:Transcript_14987/g.42535  ORF Transcript_14987/g.42535 Transcript_14987/m.42535 type:complete len:202 (-) Transcript_14987:23-628(-)
MADGATSTISLRGSVDLVQEFFEYAINSILYQRGIYPPEEFRRVAKYGLSMMVASDDGLQTYLKKILAQLKTWLEEGDVQRLVVVVTGVETNETLERWTFAVNACDTENAAPSTAGDIKAITKQIQAIIRQITASVTFLPLLDEACAFDLLVYTRKTAAVPGAWEDSDPKYIADSQEVKLRSFTTSVHSVEAAVAYKDHDA